jgi:hypothetical protein
LWQLSNQAPSSSFSSGAGNTEIDDGIGNPTNPTLATVTQHTTWPTETNLVCVAGTTRVKLSLQGQVLQDIFRVAFDNVRLYLLIENSFPNPTSIPKMLIHAVVEAAEACTTSGGRHSTLAGQVHMRLLSDEEYRTQMIRLVSELSRV